MQNSRNLMNSKAKNKKNAPGKIMSQNELPIPDKNCKISSDALKVDNQHLLFSVIYSDNEDTEQDLEVRAVLHETMAEIFHKASHGDTTFTTTTEAVTHAVKDARERGYNAPLLAYLEKIASTALPGSETPDLFDIIQEKSQSKQKGGFINTKLAADILDATRVKPQSYIYNNKTKIPTALLAREVHTLDSSLNVQRFFIDPEHKRAVYASLLNHVSQRYPIDPTDKLIMTALGNLYEEKRERYPMVIITAEDIIRRYRGLPADSKITQEAQNEIATRMEKMRHIDATFDFSQHFEYNNVGDEINFSFSDDHKRKDDRGIVIRFSYTGHLIEARRIEIEYENGSIDYGWELIRTPIVYEYAQKIRQIATIETKLLDIRAKANSSADADIIKVYLIEQINMMKAPRTKRSPRILLDSLFSDLRIDSALKSRQVKNNKVKLIRAILDKFQSDGFISSYQEHKTSRAIDGIDIKL